MAGLGGRVARRLGPSMTILMGAMREAIEGAVGEDGVVEERHPFLDGPVARDHRRGVTVALDEDVVEVAGLLALSLRRPKSSRIRRAGASQVRSSRSTE